MFIQKNVSSAALAGWHALALLFLLPGVAMATTQVLVTYKNAPNPTILANLGVPSGSQMAQQALASQIAMQAAAMQQVNPALVGAVITGDTASVPYNGYQTSSLKAGFGYQQPANGSVLFADLINVLPAVSSGSSSSSSSANSANNNTALQSQIAALQSQLAQAQAQASNSSPGVYYSSTAAQAVVKALANSTYNGATTTTLPNGMTVTASSYGGGPVTYSIAYGSASYGGQPPTSTGLTASQVSAILASSIQGVGGVSSSSSSLSKFP